LFILPNQKGEQPVPHVSYRCLLGALILVSAPAVCAGGDARPAYPFYAMDTAFQRGGLTTEQQLDLVKELGFDGIAWTETAPETAAAVAASAEKRGLKIHAIYCQARVTPDGQLTHGPQLEKLMAALKGRGTIFWLHIGGQGPAFDTLTGKEPLVGTLRGLADVAAKNDLRVAIYPHVGEWTARFGDATTVAKLVDHPRFGVTFNLCHCLAMGDEENIPKLLTVAKPVLFTVTINGADKGLKGAQWNRLIQTLDKGTFDLQVVLGTLREIQFTGPIGFQGYGIAGDARSILAPTIAAWRKLTMASRQR
jgi:sugar phosphate isomerase/epimerase